MVYSHNIWTTVNSWLVRVKLLFLWYWIQVMFENGILFSRSEIFFFRDFSEFKLHVHIFNSVWYVQLDWKPYMGKLSILTMTKTAKYYNWTNGLLRYVVSFERCIEWYYDKRKYFDFFLWLFSLTHFIARIPARTKCCGPFLAY